MKKSITIYPLRLIDKFSVIFTSCVITVSSMMISLYGIDSISTFTLGLYFFCNINYLFNFFANLFKRLQLSAFLSLIIFVFYLFVGLNFNVPRILIYIVNAFVMLSTFAYLASYPKEVNKNV